MRVLKKSRGSGRIGCIIWLAILGVIGYGLYKFIPIKVADSTFLDFLTEEASFASIRDVKQLQKEILAKAKELNLPVTEENLKIKRTKESIRIEAHYELVIQFVAGWKPYVWKRDHIVERPTFLV